MVKPQKLWRRIQAGGHNIAFDDLVRIAEAFGFTHVRTAGSHRIFSHPAIPGLLNLQPDGGQAKPYQIRQLVKLVEKYGLSLPQQDEDSP